jgi:hypothetical protein
MNEFIIAHTEGNMGGKFSSFIWWDELDRWSVDSYPCIIYSIEWTKQSQMYFYNWPIRWMLYRDLMCRSQHHAVSSTGSYRLYPCRHNQLRCVYLQCMRAWTCSCAHDCLASCQAKFNWLLFWCGQWTLFEVYCLLCWGWFLTRCHKIIFSV